jgi:hypothetical protein
MTSKKVTFNLNNIVYTTYSSEEYDRHIIECVLYRRSYNKISDYEWNKIFIELNNYKTNEMIVHKDSIQNIKLS